MSIVPRLPWVRFTAVVVLACIGVSGCRPAEPPVPTSTVPQTSSPVVEPDFILTDSSESRPALSSVSVGSPKFKDEHVAWGLDFTYDNGATGKALMIESTGGGGGWIDFDRDDWPDLFLVQGGDPLAETPHSVGDRLYRNLGGVRFVDVTGVARPPDHGYGQGLAVGDFDGDGFEDILVTNVGPDVLLKNQGDGTFQDVTAVAGVGDPRWGASAAWFDLDDDGDLDLFVGNYLKYDIHDPIVCRKDDESPAICHPEQIPAELSECYENLGDGRFQAVGSRWGLQLPNKSLGVAIADFTNDGRPDIFVANDVSANHLFVRSAPGRFEEQAVVLGCAFNARGQYQANMGIACGDYDGNGFPDLYVTHFTADSNTLFASMGEFGFRDVTRFEGLHEPTLPLLGFGTVMADFNADGAMDLFVANGHIDDWRYKGDIWKMRAQLFSYQAGQWVEHRADAAGPFFAEEHLGRAVSSADVDRDGDLDLLVVFQDAPAALLINDSPRGQGVQVDLVGRGLNRRGVGAKVTVRQGERTWVQQLVGGTSYLAAHEPVLSFGLGNGEAPCTVTVEWPPLTGRTSTQTTAINSRVRLVEPAAEKQP